MSDPHSKLALLEPLPSHRLTGPILAEGMIFIFPTPCCYGHIVEAARGEGAEGALADGLGDDEGLNHLAAMRQGHYVVIHISRSWQPGYAEVVIATRIVYCYSTHTGRD